MIQNKDAGDFSDRIQLRNDLKCNSFKWYLEKVYPEKFIPDENVYAFGMVSQWHQLSNILYIDFSL